VEVVEVAHGKVAVVVQADFFITQIKRLQQDLIRLRWEREELVGSHLMVALVLETHAVSTEGIQLGSRILR